MATASTAAATKADKREWSEDTSLQLIKEYRARPILWDKKSPYYYNKQMRPDAWEEIGQALKMSPDYCKHKMGVLMSSFRREKAKISASKVKDKKRRYISNWFAYKEMAFLKENKTENVRSTNDIMANLLKVIPAEGQKDKSTYNHANIRTYKKKNTSDQSCSFDEKAMNEKETEIMQPIVTAIISMAQAEESQLTTMITETELSNEAQMSPDPPPPLTRQPQVRHNIQPASESEEEINCFTKFIATKMKKFSQTTKNTVQKEICEIIFKADQGFYERSNEERYNSGYTDVRRLKDNPYLKNETVIKTYFSDGE